MTSAHPQDGQIRALYAQFVGNWNRRSGAGVAAAFTDDGDIVFFDGSHYRGRLSIAADLRQLFAEAPTPEYVAVARSVRPLASGVALLIAHAGMIPPGGNDPDPRLLAVHSLVAAEEGGRWRIALFQETPAAWHGHEDAREALLLELRGQLTPQ